MSTPATEQPAQDNTAYPHLLAEMAERLARMEKFFSRRFDEVSAEIHATCEMVDMAESGISNRFGEILKILSAISFHGDGSSPHNVGVELDAVVKTTEDAANRILGSSETIANLMKETAIDWNDPIARKKLFEQARGCTDDILTACAFQDLTGQRIGKTLEKIRKAEMELTDMLEKMGIKVEDIQAAEDPAQNALIQENQADKLSGQDDIDKLFA